MSLLKRYTVLSFFLILLLSSQAQPPQGYYDAVSGLNGAALKTGLYNIIKGHTVVSYASLWAHFQTTDAKPDSMVWDIYSDLPGNPPYEYVFITNQCGTGGTASENKCYNREHAVPQSWFGGSVSPMNSDLFHIYPVDGYVNLRRSNYPYGIVSNSTWTSQNGGKLGANASVGYSGIVFEPIDAYKGDLARAWFYMATRYENQIGSWNTNSTHAAAVFDANSYPVFKPWCLALLLAWHEADPVSQKEIDRNNAVFNIQGNRNPFIDEPGYVQLIWGDGLDPEPLQHVSGFSGHTITLTWTDAPGPTPPHAYLVRMSETGFDDIADPEDGVPVPDDFFNRNVLYGRQICIFAGLIPGNTYYFKLFSYRGSGADINYRTGRSAPQISLTAQ